MGRIAKAGTRLSFGARKIVGAFLLLASCAARQGAGVRETVSQSVAVADGQRWLDRIRAERTGPPWAAGIAASLGGARAGPTLEGRGGMAVAPGRSVRIILLMAGGPTLLDVWVASDRWRVAVPVRGRVERGSGDAPPDLPVSFLRRWFIRPFEGTLASASVEGEDRVLRVRDAEATLEIRLGRCDGGELTRASRRVRGRVVEQIEECLAHGRPKPGNWARYADVRTGLVARVTFESVSTGAPEPSAFADPEAGGAAL